MENELRFLRRSSGRSCPSPLQPWRRRAPRRSPAGGREWRRSPGRLRSSVEARAELSLRNGGSGSSSGEMKIDGPPVKLVRIVQDGSLLQFRRWRHRASCSGRSTLRESAIEGRLYVAGIEGGRSVGARN